VARFRSPQVVLLVEDAERAAAFYARLGFEEAFRTPAVGAPIHVDVVLDGMRLGLATRASVRDDHGLATTPGDGRAAVAVWTDDVPQELARLEQDGVPVLKPPSAWLGRLLIAWVADPDGHLVQLVQEA
jgi:catechol 2,3-dioxygenase-like lactoylglutathione lyase family enzyme